MIEVGCELRICYTRRTAKVIRVKGRHIRRVVWKSGKVRLLKEGDKMKEEKRGLRAKVDSRRKLDRLLKK
jgi:hypothetical protein